MGFPQFEKNFCWSKGVKNRKTKNKTLTCSTCFVLAPLLLRSHIHGSDGLSGLCLNEWYVTSKAGYTLDEILDDLSL